MSIELASSKIAYSNRARGRRVTTAESHDTWTEEPFVAVVPKQAAVFKVQTFRSCSCLVSEWFGF
jgi:hypothetical protein